MTGKESPKTHIVSFRVDSTLYEALETIARREHRTIGDLARLILSGYFPKGELIKNIKQIEKARKN